MWPLLQPARVPPDQALAFSCAGWVWTWYLGTSKVSFAACVLVYLTQRAVKRTLCSLIWCICNWTIPTSFKQVENSELTCLLSLVMKKYQKQEIWESCASFKGDKTVLINIPNFWTSLCKLFYWILKGQSTYLKFYCLEMKICAIFLIWVLVKSNSEKNTFPGTYLLVFLYQGILYCSQWPFAAAQGMALC